MRSLRYLNAILTVLTVLLALQLWTTWTASHDNAVSLASPAMAQSTGGIPDGGAQRKEMIDLLKQQVAQTTALVNQFSSGSARVRVDAMPSK